MRKLIFAINITLDGCVDHTKGVLNEKILDSYTQFIGDFDLIVYGRKTFEIMIPYWPNVLKDKSSTKSETEYAKIFNSIDKVVFSRTLSSVEDRNIRIVHTDLRDEIVKLKKEEGKNILTGGVSLPSQLIELDLIDEFRFMTSPVIVGEGRRLLEGITLPEKLQLKLVESRTFESGHILHRYLKP